jgi:flagellar motor switch protein FliM
MARHAETASLVRAASAKPLYAGLDGIGAAFARSIRALLTEWMPSPPEIIVSKSQAESFPAWGGQQAAFVAFCRFRLSPLKGEMLIAIPPALVARLVECHYGGLGDGVFDRDALSLAELRFLDRLGARLTDIIAASWAPIMEVDPLYIGNCAELSALAFGKEAQDILVQSLRLGGESLGTATIEIIYPDAMLRPVKALATGANAGKQDDDPLWRTRMSESVMQAHLPLRTIFARTELPLKQLLTLKSGDLIPICLPNHIPVTVSGRIFAEATVGESNGRASIRIEALKEGIAPHD